tara:strand:+ start:352 stop:1641 length:1290 start_codon:yes stop_codon:yes gene_type:complete
MPYTDGQLDAPSKSIAQSSIKSLHFELGNLNPSALVTLIEIDLSKLLDTRHIKNLSSEAEQIGFRKNLSDSTLRFHNNIKIVNSYIVWQQNTYYPAPLITEGFETSSKGVLPQPTLTISSQSESGIDQIALLKHEIRKFGDIIGAKVTRRRTFAKYLDRINFGKTRRQKRTGRGYLAQELPIGYEPDPYSELPPDVFYIERKLSENKSAIQYQLSSILDLEGIKIPKRMIVSDKCMWQYRGCGCWYQHANGDEIENNAAGVAADGSNVPVLRKAGLKKLPTEGGLGAGVGLPYRAPPVADDNNEKIADLISPNLILNTLDEWKPSEFKSNSDEVAYSAGSTVYLLKDDIKYYYVAKKNLSQDENRAYPPPNKDYWIADECSKTLTGCRLRWGLNRKGGVNNKNPDQNCAIVAGKLPFGGFPAARKIQSQ